MKTLDECKGIVARKHGFLYWQSVLTSSNVDLLFTEVAELYASQSKPQEIPEENRQKLFNHMSTEHGLTLLESEMNSIYSICIGHEEYVKYLNWLHSKPVDTKTVDAVEFAEWLKVNNHELKLDSGYRSDEHNAKLLNLYKQDIKSKK